MGAITPTINAISHQRRKLLGGKHGAFCLRQLIRGRSDGDVRVLIGNFEEEDSSLGTPLQEYADMFLACAKFRLASFIIHI